MPCFEKSILFYTALLLLKKRKARDRGIKPSLKIQGWLAEKKNRTPLNTPWHIKYLNVKNIFNVACVCVSVSDKFQR